MFVRVRVRVRINLVLAKFCEIVLRIFFFFFCFIFSIAWHCVSVSVCTCVRAHLCVCLNCKSLRNKSNDGEEKACAHSCAMWLYYVDFMRWIFFRTYSAEKMAEKNSQSFEATRCNCFIQWLPEKKWNAIATATATEKVIVITTQCNTQANTHQQAK